MTKFTPDGSALVYSTYLGGSGSVDDRIAIALDAEGHAYVTGATNGADFPLLNPLQADYGKDPFLYSTVFVTELTADGSGLVYSTFLGGNHFDGGLGIAVDAAGNAYVTGYTDSVNFPTANPLQPVLAGSQNAFVAELAAGGSALIYSTFLGGSGQSPGDFPTGIALDAADNVYVVGGTTSPDFPTVNAMQPIYGGGGLDGFVAKISP